MAGAIDAQLVGVDENRFSGDELAKTKSMKILKNRTCACAVVNHILIRKFFSCGWSKSRNCSELLKQNLRVLIGLLQCERYVLLLESVL